MIQIHLYSFLLRILQNDRIRTARRHGTCDFSTINDYQILVFHQFERHLIRLPVREQDVVDVSCFLS